MYNALNLCKIVYFMTGSTISDRLGLAEPSSQKRKRVTGSGTAVFVEELQFKLKAKDLGGRINQETKKGVCLFCSIKTCQCLRKAWHYRCP